MKELDNIVESILFVLGAKSSFKFTEYIRGKIC